MKTIEKLTRKDGRAVTLEQLDSGEFLMSGAHGTHTLAAGSDPQRVHAHWEGFCQLNDVQNRAMIVASADPKKVGSSHALELDVQRALYCMGLLEARLEALDMKAGQIRASWADAGDGAHLVDQLLNIVADDDHRDALRAEMDAEINGDHDEVAA
jgi:hypothetical protein